MSVSLLADHFVQVGLKLQGPVPITYLHQALHVYSSLNILGTLETWLEAEPSAYKPKPLVAPHQPRKLLV